MIDMTLSTLDHAYVATRACQRAMLEADNEMDLMKTIANIMVDVGHYRFVWIGFLEKDAAKTIHPVAFAGHEDGYLDNIRINLTDPLLVHGPSGQAMLTRKPAVCQDLAHNEEFIPWRDNALKRGYHSSVGVPLSYLNHEPIGIMNVYSDIPDAFSKQEVDLLVEMTQILTFGLMMRRTQQGLNQTAYQLDESLMKMQRIITQTVSALAATVEIRDPYTAGHQLRVTKLAIAICKKLNLGQDRIDEITVASNLHDIGKITVPIEILSKPGNISHNEREIIKTHTTAGHEIIKDIEFPWPIAEIVYQHHERLDGTGYPRGLKGKEILKSARILCVADVVEAMVSHRPYRPGFGVEVALAELKENKGRYYDADVVEACVDLFEKDGFTFDD